MFRRRTDQVYATLQQVQRRISEQTGGAQPPPRPVAPAIRTPLPGAPAAAPPRPTSRIATPLPEAAPQPRPAAAPQPLSAAPFPHAAPASAGVYLTVVGLLGIILGALLLGLGLGWMLFASAGATRESLPPPPAPAAMRPQEEAPAALHVLVLFQDRATAQSLDQYRKGAERYNAWIQKKPGGWQPLFGMRQTADGSVQLVYGISGDRVGIPRTAQLNDLAQLLARPAAEGGLGAQVRWMTVR